MMYSNLFFLALVTPALLYACREDIDKMEVPDQVWAVMLLPTIPFVIYNVATVSGHFYWLSISVIVGVGISCALWLCNVFGGADAKMVMLLSVIMASPIAIFGMVLGGLILAVCMMKYAEKKGYDRHLPFVPMLCVGLVVVILL